MDFRPANLLTRQGSIVALVDWSNNLLGDPALELARIAELIEVGGTGRLATDFLEGYGTPAPFARIPEALELLYRWDTAVMLTNVFLHESFSPDLGQRQVERVQTLHRRLQDTLF